MPGFRMKFDKNDLKRPEPVPAGVYDLRLIGFEPKTAKSGESINLNPVFEFTTVNNQKGDPKKLKFAFVGNTSVPNLLQDMCHGFGELMEEDPNDPDAPAALPGIWDADKLKFKEDKPETWVYSGPLLNKVLKAELYVDNYNGRENNKVLRFYCMVPNCAERFPKIQHSDNMNWGK